MSNRPEHEVAHFFDSLLEATQRAQAKLDAGEPATLEDRLLDLAAKWSAIAGDERDERSAALRYCAGELRSAIREGK